MISKIISHLSTLFIVPLGAAHCNVPDQNDYVFVSWLNLDNVGTQVNILRKVVHPAFNELTFANDIMLLFLDQSLTEIPTISINRNYNVPAAGDMLTVIGNGRTNERDSESPGKLYELIVPTVDHITCSNDNFGRVNEELMLCAGVPEGGKDSCQGGEYSFRASFIYL